MWVRPTSNYKEYGGQWERESCLSRIDSRVSLSRTGLGWKWGSGGSWVARVRSESFGFDVHLSGSGSVVGAPAQLVTAERNQGGRRPSGLQLAELSIRGSASSMLLASMGNLVYLEKTYRKCPSQDKTPRSRGWVCLSVNVVGPPLPTSLLFATLNE